ncbi:hypothetical protein K2173_019027 [Erythroxylum novogranatense]|uniref:Glycosyltransferase n=1 Tax=Erythroxylum novogranatense TaxID=1862640 RepID=A0AAV8STE5_9ROSI|nr:hypothetical protein K2173_019027 [Erythroxylum novogranatense]
MMKTRILLVTFPSQGHINPALQFAKRLVGVGVEVTVATTIGALRRMYKNESSNKSLSFAGFSDGYDDGFNPNPDSDTLDHYFSKLSSVGPKSLAQLIVASSENGNPFTCVVYCTLLPWVAKVARELHVPSIFLWNQPAAVLSLYYHSFNGYGNFIKENINNPKFLLEVPGLPPLGSSDVPSFFNETNKNNTALPIMKQHLENLEEEANPLVLVNTFDDLESEALKSIDKYRLVGIGPLIPSAFLDGKDPSDTSFGADLFKGTNDYIEWLNSKPASSVIYISFGSISMLSKSQMEELALALVDVDRPFLWVMRENENEEERLDDTLSCKGELEGKGKIVPWCSQVGVLSHPSVGCFLTHCGWNSTFESLVSGVPMVSFPQWTDQPVNAKLVQDLWKTGVRVRANEDGTVEKEEFKRCIEMVMDDGERAQEMRRNAMKWKGLARETSKEGGSSDKNLKAFMLEVEESLQSIR